MPGSTQNTATLDSGRQVSLVETGIAALLIHAVAYLILFALGWLGVFLDEIPPRAEEPEVHFTFAPEVETADSEQPAAPGSEPGAPAPAEPVVDPRLTSPPVAAEPPMSPTPPIPFEQTAESAELEPPSEGLAEGLEAAFDEPQDSEAQPAEELREAQAEAAPSEAIEATEESFLTETAGGERATLQEPSSAAPAPPLGRPEGPSLDQRISEFSRVVERSRERTAASRPQQPRNSFEPDWASLPTTGQAIGNLTFESGDYDWEDYSRQIYFIIWRAWHNRLLARADDFERWAQQSQTWMLDHVNGVRFTIEDSGQIVDIVLERESGSEPFDLSSIEGLDEALLPPLPDDFPRDREIVHVYFIGQGPVGNMRRTLQQYKSAGWF